MDIFALIFYGPCVDGDIDGDDDGDGDDHGRLFCPDAAAPLPLAFEYSTNSSSNMGPDMPTGTHTVTNRPTDSKVQNPMSRKCDKYEKNI